jgi:hypothetical protein
MFLTPGRLKRFSVRILVWLASDLKSLFGVSFLLGVLLAILFHNYQVSTTMSDLFLWSSYYWVCCRA